MQYLKTKQRCLIKLIECGADIESKDLDQRTPLGHATYLRSLTFLTKLIEIGANIESRDRFGFTPLICAASRRFGFNIKGSDVGSKLIACGANIEVKDNEGRTALTHAAMNDSFQVCISVHLGV